MKIDKLKEIFEDESLKYALATNLAKYGRPQSKKSDKKATLTKGLEKKREKNVKDLKKSMGENLGSEFPGKEAGKGYTMSREIIDMLRSKVYPKLNDDELEEFGTEMHDHFMAYMKESVNENKSGLDRIKFHFDKLFGPDLKFNINRDPNNPERDRIDVRGSQQDLMNFGSELGGEKMEGYEVFWTQDDDRGEIVRIVKSDSISRGGVNEEMDPKEMKTGTYAGKKVVIHMHGPETEWKVEFIDTGKIVDYVDLMANLKFDDGTTYMDYLKEKKDKADRCLRVARRKMPQSSAYRSGLIVKCRKGMIWKKEK